VRHRKDIFLFVVLTASASLAENWSGWRGPDRNGVSSEAGLPLRWSAEEGVRWRTPLPGSGISSPIIWKDQVFVTASDGAKQGELHVLCLSLSGGQERWHLRLWGTAPTRYHANKSSMASPTPVTDGKHIFAFFGTGDVFCVDFSGDLVWHRSLATEYGRFENRFAATSSPLLYRDLLLLQCDHYGDSYTLAIDKETGANRWKTDRPEAWLSWSSPQLASLNDGQSHELILCGSLKIDALDPLTGEELWSAGGMRRECIPTPVLGHGLIYAVSGPKGPTMALKPGGRGDVSGSHVVWSNPRGAPFVPSAILVGDYYYLVDDNGVATCLDAHDGKRVWQKRFPGKYTASPVASQGKIYFMNESGETTVIQADTPKYDQQGRNSLGESVFATAAIAQQCLFIRTTQALFCIDGK
jgi:outer membrane protein assembly factor BamB